MFELLPNPIKGHPDGLAVFMDGIFKYTVNEANSFSAMDTVRMANKHVERAIAMGEAAKRA